MHSTHNKGKSVVAERFIRTLKNEVYKYMTSVSKNIYTEKLDDIMNKYNNTSHRTIKMKPVDVKSNTYIKSGKKINDKYSIFKISDHVRTSKYKNIFAKVYVPNWPKEVFMIKKVENTVPWTYVISDLKGEEIVLMFYEKKNAKNNSKTV